ncbi:hypothetical protein RSAG8_11284, partial [Rhizoctonia solani AG-8 WAC10335]
ALDCLVNEAGEVPEVSELAGNTSFGWFLRTRNQVASSTTSTTPLRSGNTRVPGSTQEHPEWNPDWFEYVPWYGVTVSICALCGKPIQPVYNVWKLKADAPVPPGLNRNHPTFRSHVPHCPASAE